MHVVFVNVLLNNNDFGHDVVKVDVRLHVLINGDAGDEVGVGSANSRKFGIANAKGTTFGADVLVFVAAKVGIGNGAIECFRRLKSLNVVGLMMVWHVSAYADVERSRAKDNNFMTGF